jgi:hypothetical protein
MPTTVSVIILIESVYLEELLKNCFAFFSALNIMATLPPTQQYKR